MKIKIRAKDYEEVLALPHQKHKKPHRQGFLARTLLRVVSAPDLLATHFKLRKIGMEKLGRREPCLFLMNHSSFIDLEIASTVLYPRPFQVVCTLDGFVGKARLMRWIGCIPTQKFVADLALLRDMQYTVETLKSSILMFPEAGYSFDGRATRLPDSLGACIKRLGVPVVMISTRGAFLRDPLYNNLQRRRVRVSADMEYLLSPDEIAALDAEEIGRRIGDCFSFDAFRRQQEERVRIDEDFRADGLNRLLYKCSACETEGAMEGKGITLTCHACGKTHRLDEYGYLCAEDGKTRFPHIPDWFDWERACVRREIEAGEYRMETDVDICMLADTKCLYRVGEGRLTHTCEGFHLVGCDGKLDYKQSPHATYTLNADFNWYEIGDTVCIGHMGALYYCFPKQKGDLVAKARLATEELYTRNKRERQGKTGK